MRQAVPDSWSGLAERTSRNYYYYYYYYNYNSLLAAAVTAKIEDGNIKAAIRILSSEEKPAVDEEVTYMKLIAIQHHQQSQQESRRYGVLFLALGKFYYRYHKTI